MQNSMRCDKCGSFNSTIKSKYESIPVRGEDIYIESNVRVCECGNELFDEDLEEQNLLKAYDEYRRKKDIITPEEIKKTREKYGLSQRLLGKLLGWGEITIHRYETGAVPDASHNKILKLLDNPEMMRNIIINSKETISKSTYNKVMSKIDFLDAQNEEKQFILCLQRKFAYPTITIESGYTQFDLLKFMNVVLYFAKNVDQLSKTKLNKLLFYSDFNYFKKYTISLTGLKYIKLEHGPVPKDYETLLWAMESSGLISITPSKIGNYSGYLINALSEYNPNIFNEKELLMLEKIKQKYGDYSATEISNISHNEQAWLATDFYQIISYQYAVELTN